MILQSTQFWDTNLGSAFIYILHEASEGQGKLKLFRYHKKGLESDAKFRYSNCDPSEKSDSSLLAHHELSSDKSISGLTVTFIL